jgi:hypothetical protein
VIHLTDANDDSQVNRLRVVPDAVILPRCAWESAVDDAARATDCRSVCRRVQSAPGARADQPRRVVSVDHRDPRRANQHHAHQHPSTASAAGPVPTSIQQACDARGWPQPVPSIVGAEYNQAMMGALMCFDGLRLLAPDGHAMTNDTAGVSKYTQVGSITPPPGTPVGRTDPVTVRFVPADLSGPPAYRPCDWVSTGEAAGFLGGASVSVDPISDEAGSVNPSCRYLADGHVQLISDLQLPGSFPIDAKTEFDMTVAAGKGSEVSGMPGRAYCGDKATGANESRLVVLLSSGRLYRRWMCSMSLATR